MTPSQFRRCLAALRWSQTELARLLDVEQVTVRRWATGLHVILGPVALWMLAMAREALAAITRHPPARL